MALLAGGDIALVGAVLLAGREHLLLRWQRASHGELRADDASTRLHLAPQFREVGVGLRQGKRYLACCLAKQACRMRRSARYIRLPDLLMERDELAATERSNAKILRKYARYEILVLDEWLTEDVNDVDISFLFELIERRYAAKSTVLCTQYTPAEWHGRLGGGVQADAMVDRLVHGAVRIDLGDVNVRKLLAEKK